MQAIDLKQVLIEKKKSPYPFIFQALVAFNTEILHYSDMDICV